MISLKEVCISYGEERVLCDCSMEIKNGERIAIMGHSGCGKTTLLHILAGLVRPDRGSVCVDGTVSCVFQEPSLLPWLNAAENINVVLSDTVQTMAEAESWLDVVGLSDCREKYPHQLSGGQKQRVAIARALAYGGDVLLLDEPLKGLDAETKAAVAAEICRATEGKTLVLACHDPEEAVLLTQKTYHYEVGSFVMI